MSRKELEILSDAARRRVGGEFGFASSGCASWIETDGYFFYVEAPRMSSISLKVKPLYVDDFWWNLIDSPLKNHEGHGWRASEDAVQGQEIRDFRIRTSELEWGNEAELESLWRGVFGSVVEWMDFFIKSNPVARRFIPAGRYKVDRKQLLYFICLIHNGGSDEVVRLIREYKKEGLQCRNFYNGLSTYDCILNYCIRYRKADGWLIVAICVLSAAAAMLIPLLFR